MREWLSSGGSGRMRLTGPRFSDDQKKAIFRQMVAAELSDGSLPSRRRRELVRFAQHLGIQRREAEWLIAQVQYGTDAADPPDLSPDASGLTLLLTQPSRKWFRITVGAMALAVAVLLAAEWFGR
jgi:hypothetical protein